MIWLKLQKKDRSHQITYDGSYLSIQYLNGDVPSNIGVCTDVVIRSYSTLGSDLQQLVHKNIVNNFSSYPSKRIWGLTKPDKNIDHRRVPNLQTFFKRHGKSFPLTNNAKKIFQGIYRILELLAIIKMNNQLAV